MKIVKQVTLDCAVVDDAHWFKLGYSADLHTHLMVVSVAWVAGYERYYRMGADDRVLYASDRASFYRKYANEIGQSGNTCYTERLIGAQALRDYDGRRNSFQRAYPAKYGNPFQHYAYIGGILFARILWERGTYYVPPMQAVDAGDGTWHFPLRERCRLLCDDAGEPLCYYYIEEEQNHAGRSETDTE